MGNSISCVVHHSDGKPIRPDGALSDWTQTIWEYVSDRGYLYVTEGDGREQGRSLYLSPEAVQAIVEYTLNKIEATAKAAADG